MRFALDSPRQYLQLLVALVFITVIAVFVAQCPSAGQQKVAGERFEISQEVPNLFELRKGIMSGGQPSGIGMRMIARHGTRTVVNFRPHEETGARNEAREAAALGMRYVNIPVTPSSFTRPKIEEFACILKDERNLPVFLHCRSGNRAAGMWFVYRVVVEKASIPEAISEARAAGLERSLEVILLDFLSTAEAQSVEEICQADDLPGNR